MAVDVVSKKRTNLPIIKWLVSIFLVAFWNGAWGQVVDFEPQDEVSTSSLSTRPAEKSPAEGMREIPQGAASQKVTEESLKSQDAEIEMLKKKLEATKLAPTSASSQVTESASQDVSANPATKSSESLQEFAKETASQKVTEEDIRSMDMEIEMLKKQLEIRRLKEEIAGSGQEQKQETTRENSERGRFQKTSDKMPFQGNPSLPVAGTSSALPLGLYFNVRMNRSEYEADDYEVLQLRSDLDAEGEGFLKDIIEQEDEEGKFDMGFALEVSYLQSLSGTAPDVSPFLGVSSSLTLPTDIKDGDAEFMPIETYAVGGFVGKIGFDSSLFVLGGLGLSKLNWSLEDPGHEVEDDGLGYCWQVGAGFKIGRFVAKISRNVLVGDIKVKREMEDSMIGPWSFTMKANVEITTTALSVGMFF